MSSLCVVERVSFSYDSQNNVLSDISFSVKEKEIVGILGRNGSGKTTLLNLITGFLYPKNGCVLINNKRIEEYPLIERAKSLSYIQQRNLYIPSYYKVEDFIIEGRRPFRRFGFYIDEDYALLDEMMNDCDLSSFRGRFMHELSGGEQQRCILAREIMKQARLFLLDEPCSAMDIKYQKDFFNIARKIKEEKAGSVVFTIHDINLAIQNCDRIILMNEGTVLYDGVANAISCNSLSKAFGVEVRPIPDCNTRYLYY